MKAKDTRDIHIACINNPGQSFFALCGQGIQDQAHDHGIALSVRSAYTNAQAEAEFLDCLRDPYLDAVIIVSIEASLPGQNGARQIPVINCDAVLHGTAACELKPDLYRAATLAANYLVERLHGQGKVVHIQGPLNNVTATLPRSQGFAAVLGQHPSMTVVEREGSWNREPAAQVMEAALAAHPDVQAVFAHNDEMALGALEALEAAGRRDVVVVGVDAIPESLTAIQAGRMGATVDSSPYTLGRTALTHALQIVQGKSTPATVLTDVQLITTENLLDATLATMRVFPNVLRDLVKGNQAQRQLQDEIIATQRGLIQELSTPIIPVSDTVLVVPLIGAIDSRRAAQITESLLEAISAQQTQVLIIDITGVAVVDTNVINHLLQTTRAARLLGTTPVLVGIGPEVAQTIVQLGVDLSSIVTRSTLQAGLAYATTTLRR